MDLVKDRGDIGAAGSERRRYPRFRSRITATITATGQPERACEVRDYCAGGMLVALSGEAGVAPFEKGQSVRLALRLLAGRDAAPMVVPATVAWVGGAQLGIAFARPIQALVNVLQKREQQTAAPSPSVSTQDPPGMDAGAGGRLLDGVRQLGREALPPILRGLLAETTDRLLEAADRMGSSGDQQQVYVDLRALEGLRLGERLVQAVMSRMLAPAPAGEADPGRSRNPGELSLVDADEFERWLEASRAAAQLERRFGEQLMILGSRLAAMGDERVFKGLDLPFEPRHFTDALKAVAAESGLGAVSRELLFDCAVAVLSDKLGALYQRVNQLLDSLGAPPPAEPAALYRRSHPQTGRPRRPDDGVDAAPAGDAATPPTPAGDDGAARRTVAVDAEALEQLVARDREMRRAQAQEMLGNLVDAVDGSRGMRAWLQKLDGPAVSEAVTDPNFFQDRNHPLHDIFDALGELQLLRPAPETDGDELRKEVDALLEPLAEGPADAGVLRSVAARVSGLARERSERYEHNVRRVIEACEGRERLRVARQAVARELERRYLGRQVPEVAVELIEAGWRKVLELAWLKHGAQAPEFARQLSTLDAVMARLGAEAFESGVEPPEPDALLGQICKELETTVIDPFQRAGVGARLRRELLSPLPSSRLVPMPRLSDPEDRAGEGRPDDLSENEWKQALAASATLRLGDRVRFAGEDGREQVGRVAWIRDDREIFTLVDHRGMRMRDLALSELAAGLCRQQIHIEQVDGRPLSERAIERMLDAMEKRIGALATDALTGLMNRQQFNAMLEQAVPAAERAGRRLALLWLDLDQFRLINDIHGYPAGDRVLAEVSGVLKQQAGEGRAAHFGADHFVLLLETDSVETAATRAEQLLQAIAGLSLEWEGRALTLSASVGVALSEHDSVGGLMQAAETALQVAKQSGGGQLYVYSADDPGLSRRRDSVAWVARVDEALVEGELRLRCQPIVPVRPGEGMAPHYEVLLGVLDGARESLSIAEFIEAAERYKRMRAVDRWVTRTVFDWIAANRALMPRLHGLAVNLSGQTASDPTFIDFVRQQFQRTGIEPDWVSFEVTETAALGSLSGTAGIICELKKLGCKVALDDFGSGQASYSYLRELPVDWLKIDGVFVRDIAEKRDDYAVVKSINEIGHFLGKQTIAEYVKDDPTLQCVREIGVDFAQGFGISPPILLDDLLDIPTDG